MFFLIVVLLAISTLVVALSCGYGQVSEICYVMYVIIFSATVVVITILFVYRLIRPCVKKIATTSLSDILQAIAILFIILVGVVTVAFTLWTSLADSVKPTHPIQVDGGELLTAAATILGLTVFGSALGAQHYSKDMIKGIAYILILIIVVQVAFMSELTGVVRFPVVIWIPMTAISLMLVVFAMVANKVRSDEGGGNRKESPPH